MAAIVAYAPLDPGWLRREPLSIRDIFIHLVEKNEPASVDAQTR
jgi:hypothetical protein